MKQTIQLIVISILLLQLSSCGGDKQKKDSTQSSLTALVDGKDYKARFVSGFVSPVTKTLLLTGAQGDGEDIQLFVPIDIGTGTYSYEQPVQGKYQKTDDDGDGGFAISGSLIIASHDKENGHIVGSFNFDTKPIVTSGTSHTLRDGSFSIFY